MSERDVALVGQLVRETRKKAGVKVQELADEIGITNQHLSRIELGGTPSIETLLKISERLGVTTDYLLTGHEQNPLSAAGAIRSEPNISPDTKKHLIALLEELRITSPPSAEERERAA
jgi:transcriptional regulator with XRE-family HTH domain